MAMVSFPVTSGVLLTSKVSHRDAPLSEYGAIQLQDGVHAVVEVAMYDEELDEEAQNEDVMPSDLFVPLTLEVNAIDDGGEVTARKFFLAPVTAIVGPCIVIPDVGGATQMATFK